MFGATVAIFQALVHLVVQRVLGRPLFQISFLFRFFGKTSSCFKVDQNPRVLVHILKNSEKAFSPARENTLENTPQQLDYDSPKGQGLLDRA